MRRIATTALAGLMMATSFVPFTGPAAARDIRFERERYVERWCDRNPRDSDCRDWRVSRDRWDDDRYRRWYRHRHRDSDDIGSALFGLAAGALIGGTLANPGWLNRGIGSRDVSAHVARCQARFRSYDPASDTYLGYDGLRHRCRL
jgi:hypothetical protein